MAEEIPPSGQPPSDRPHVRSAAASLDVFISYASADGAVAEAVVAALEDHGLTCWIAPRDVTPGEFYAGAIVHAIDATRVTVLILSKHAVLSAHVAREVERASSRGHPVISLRIDETPLPAELEYFLNTSHWLNASEGDLSAALPRLVDSVRRILARQATRAATMSAIPAEGAWPSRKGRPGGDRPRSRALMVCAVLVALALAGYAAYRLASPAHEEAAPRTKMPVGSAPLPTAIPEKSVAVLPFIDMSEKKDQEYFSDGLSEELIDKLTKVPDLRVPARTSSFYFKGKQTKISDIGRELGVTHVLEGSVRKSGNTLRITAQLIRVDTGYHVWSQTYDRSIGDIFRVQDDIAAAVVNALQASLQAPSPAQGVSNVEAYTLMLQGRFLMRQIGGLDATRRAVAYYQQAARIEPNAAPIWAGLARASITEWTYDTRQASVRELAAKAAQRALALDPASCDAHVALGKVRYWADWDWAAADAEFTQARALNPQDSYANFFSGELAVSLGKLNQGVEFYTLAIDQDPLNFSALESRASLYGILGRHADELAALHRLADINPDVRGIRVGIAMAQLRAGEDPNAALTMIQGESEEEQRLWALGWAYATLGRMSEADAAIASYAQKYGATQPGAVAALYAARGASAAAFEWLDRAYANRDTMLVDLKVSRYFASLHGDPRYRAMLHKMNLPQ